LKASLKALYEVVLEILC